MKLYYMEILNPRKACAVAKYLNAPVEYVHVDLGQGQHTTPEFLAVNPNAKIPALEDGDLKLWEADAIMCHLARKAESDLWPRDDARQIEIIRWLSWNANHFTRKTGELYFQYIVKPLFNIGPPDPAAVKDATDGFKRFGRILDDHLRGRKYLVGDALSVADFAVAITLPYADTIRLPLADFPEIVRWHDRLNEIAAWRDPFPARKAVAA